MSYALIYSKLRELEERLLIIESKPKTADVGNTISSFGLTTDTADSAAGILDELNQFKTNFANLLNECNPLSVRVGKLSEDIATLATKEELPDVSGFATKEEVADLLTKFDNLINVVSQLNIKINEANDKISALESS
jgi:predicted  nucleic acid-binding Zn-ribbon protein